MKRSTRRLLRVPIVALGAARKPLAINRTRQFASAIRPAVAPPARHSLQRALAALLILLLPVALAAADAPTRYRVAAGAAALPAAGRYQLTLTAPEEPAAPRFHLLAPAPDKLQAGTCEIADAIFAHGFEN